MESYGIETTEMVPESPITDIQTGLSFVLIDSSRGIPNNPVPVVSMPQVFDNFGWYKEGKLSHYSMRGAFNNGARTLFASRLTGPNARSSAGGEAKKVGTSKAQLVTGTGNDQLNIIAKTGGVVPTKYAFIITTAADDNTVVAKSGNIITISLGMTSAWKSIPLLVATLLNGKAALIDGASATTAIVFYAKASGAAGNALSVEVIDTGSGVVTYVLNPAKTKLTINLQGSTETVANVVSAVNALDDTILAYSAGDGAGNIAAMTETLLSGGESTISALITASAGGTGIGTLVTMSKTTLKGTGVLAAGADTITDNSLLEALTPISSKLLPGNIVVLENGADKGAYLVTEVLGNTGVNSIRVTLLGATSWAGWSASQTSVIYTVYGTLGAYGSITAWTNSPGIAGDNCKVTLTLERGGQTIKAVVTWLDDDDVIRTLETYTGLSPVPTNGNFVDTKIARDALWFGITTAPEVIKSEETGASSTAGSNLLTLVGATFVTEDIKQGDSVIVTSATNAADVRVFSVLSVTDEENLTTDVNFTGTNSGTINFTIVGSDTDGAALLALIGSSGLEIEMSGGVDDTPNKDDYEGSESLKTGIYSLNKVPEEFIPNKFWLPESATVVDDTGVDATFQLDQAMADFAAIRDSLVYLRTTEFGLTPTTLMTKVSSEALESKYTALYYPWVRVSDPLTGSWRWCVVTGHMAGLFDRVDAGPEGMHKAPANELLRDIVTLPGKSALEYNCDPRELKLLNEMNVNVVIRLGGYRPFGDFLMTNLEADRFIHKRLVEIRTTQSIVRALQIAGPYAVQSPSTWAKFKMKIEDYMSQYDRRFFVNGAFENKSDPSAKPWYIKCGFENNDLGSTLVNIEHGYYVTDTILKIAYKYGLLTGTSEVSVEQG